MMQFQENIQTDGKTDRRKDGQILFHRTFPITARGPINYFTKLDLIQCIFNHCIAISGAVFIIIILTSENLYLC